MGKITIPQIGETYVGTNPAVVKCARVTVGVSSGNPDVVIDPSAAVAIFTVPAGCLVTDFKGRVLEAFTASVNLDFGDSDDVDGYLAEAALACTAFSSDTVNVLKRNEGGYIDATGKDGGRVYDAAQDILCTASTATPVVGKAEVYIFYTEAGLL
jgi:hypothetical protein